jgi:hypothetical protein
MKLKQAKKLLNAKWTEKELKQAKKLVNAKWMRRFRSATASHFDAGFAGRLFAYLAPGQQEVSKTERAEMFRVAVEKLASFRRGMTEAERKKRRDGSRPSETEHELQFIAFTLMQTDAELDLLLNVGLEGGER